MLNRVLLSFVATVGTLLFTVTPSYSQRPAPPTSAIVINPPSNPVPVSVSPVPYQHIRAINTNACDANQCKVSFPPVPAGQRLVITHVSAQLGDMAEIVILEIHEEANLTQTLFVPKPYAGAGFLSSPVTFYYESGTTPGARMFVTNPPVNPSSLIVQLVGYLVPAP